MKLRLSTLLALCLPLALLPVAPARAQAGAEKVTSVEGITEYRLPNGLKLLVFPDPAASTITVNVTYLVGSRHEGAGEGGMAHLLEHMVFKGSPRHPNITQELTERGARPNGTTSWDRTNYYETFRANDDNLRWALDLESDRMVNSFLRKSDLDSEFSVVRSEFESGENSPFNVLFKNTMAAAYTAHSYGRPIIGNRSDVERVPIERLQEFYRKYYQPDNAVLTVAGKFDEARLVPMVVEYFGKIPKPQRTLAPTYTVEPAQDGERTTVTRRVGDVQAMIALYHVPDAGHPDTAPLAVLMQVLGNAPAGRLHRSLVETKKATSAFAYPIALNEPGLVAAGAILGKDDKAEDVKAELLGIVEGIARTPLTAEEVERAKTRITTLIEQGLRDSTRVGLTLSESIAQGDWRLLFLGRDRLRAVTLPEVQRVAATYLKPSNRTLGQFIPQTQAQAQSDRVTIAPKTDLAAALKDYKGDAAMAQGEAFDPSPANIESRLQRSRLGSGMKVALLPKKTRGNSVQAVISLHFGTAEALNGQSTNGDNAAGMLMRGTTQRSRQQIQDELDRLKARLSIGGGATGVTASIETTRDNLPAVLRLAGEVLRQPAFPEAEFEQIRKERLTFLELGRSEPQTLASNRMSRALYRYPRGDVREVETLEQQIESARDMKLADARAFHQRFYGASDAELAVVGDFDVAAVRAAIESQFGAWKSPSPYRQVSYAYQRTTPANETIETPDKANAVFLAGQRIELKDDDAAFAPMLLGNHLLGGGFLSSRLTSRIRVKDGLSYGAGSSLSVSAYEREGRFQGYAIAAPQNVAKVEAAFKEEIAKALKDGFDAKEVDAGRDGWLQSQQVNRASDAGLARLITARDRHDRTLAWDAAFEDRVRATTPQSIVEALRSQIDPAQMVIIKAGDFKKAAP